MRDITVNLKLCSWVKVNSSPSGLLSTGESGKRSLSSYANFPLPKSIVSAELVSVCHRIRPIYSILVTVVTCTQRRKAPGKKSLSL